MKPCVLIIAFVFAFGGCAVEGGMPSVIIHQYNYQAQPPALAPGTPPNPPWTGPVDYPTIYNSAWDDPTLVIFKNDCYRKIRVEIDGQKTIVLGPYGATADLHLGVGQHRVRVVIEKPTATQGTLEVLRFFQISIWPEGQSQIFHVY